MVDDGRARRLGGLPKDLVDAVEEFGVLLSFKVVDILKAAIATETRQMRIDLRCALQEFRGSLPPQESEAAADSINVQVKSKRHNKRLLSPSFGPKLSTKSNVSGKMGPTWTSASSESISTLPARRSRLRLSSGKLEKQLAEKVIEAKLMTTGMSDGEVPSSPDQARRQISFQQVVPADVECYSDRGDSPKSLVGSGRESSFRSITPNVSNGAQSMSSSSSRVHFEQVPNAPIESDDAASPRLTSSSTVERIRSRRQSTMSSSATMNRWKNAARKFYDPKHNSVYESWGPARKINGAVWRALGLLPWNKKFVWLSKTYQLFFFAVLLASTLLVLAKVESVSFQGTGMDSVDMFPRMDKIVAVGSLLAVSTSFWKYQAYMESQHLVESYLSRAGFLVELDWKSCVENGLLFLLWLCCVVSMFFGHGFELHLYHVGFAFNVLTLFGACAYVIRLCRGLHFAVDSFCQYITEINFDFDDAMQEWFLLHCTVRTACSSLQLCFVILQLTALGIVLFGAASLYLAENAIEEITVATYVPAVLCIIVLLRLSMCAAFVSDLCKRVPMLVNSSNAEFDLKRMYLVEYIVHCETGFYIFEVRLSSALLLKVFYVACAATLGLLTQVVG